MPWAIHGQTTAEIVLARADASKPNTGLTNYTGSKPRKSDVGIAKNYLNEDELKALNLIVSAFHLFQLNRTARNIFCSVERDTVRRRALPTHCRSFFSVQFLPGKPCASGSAAIVSRICFVSAGAKRGRCRRFGDRSPPRARVRCRREPSPSRTRRTGRSARPIASRSSAGWRFDKAPKIAPVFARADAVARCRKSSGVWFHSVVSGRIILDPPTRLGICRQDNRVG